MHSIKFKYMMLQAALLALGVLMPRMASAQSPDGASLLSEGRWIKVHTDTTSVYRLPYTQLRDWGFTDPDKVVVAGYGSVERVHSLDTAPDDVPVLPVYRDRDAIYFYAEGDTRLTLTSTPGTSGIIPFAEHYNYYSKGSYYFIGEREGVSSPDIVSPQTDPAESYTGIDTHYAIDNRVYRENHPALHGLRSYSHNISAASPRTIGFDISDNAGSGVLYYSYVWHHGQSTSQSIRLQFSNGILSSTGTYDRHPRNNSDDHILYKAKENARMSLTFADDADHFSATVSNPNGVFDALALSRHTLLYKRHNVAEAAPSTLYLTSAPAPARAAVRLRGSVPGLVAWDVTEPRAPRNLEVSADGSGDTFIYADMPTTSVKLHTFRPSGAIPVPEYAGEVQPQNIHMLPDADMLIVTTEATYAAAQRLAALHEKWQGMKVNVVRQADVFNEFSSGAHHPNAVRQLVRQLSARPQPVRYVLMFGAGSWDSRGTFDHSGTEYLVMYGTESVDEACDETKFYASDLYFGTLAQSITPSLAEMRADVAVSVGRVPALDAVAAQAYVDKCEMYFSDPVKAGHFNHAIIKGGISDESAHLLASENFGEVIRSHTKAPTLNRAHLALFTLSNPQRVESQMLYDYLDSRLAGDSRLFSYTGHSSINVISHTSHTVSREESMAYGSLPMVYMSSCNTTPIDISDKSLGVTMILHTPGPIAVIGAGNEVYLTYNVNLNKEYMERFYTSEGGECLGDVFRTSVNALKSGRNQHINDLCYNFLGDPALPRYLPEATVNVTSIGEATGLAEGSRVEVKALRRTSVAGNVTRPDGSVDTSFSGKLYLNIYNTPYTRTTLRHNSKDLAKDLVIDEDVLYASVVNVQDGLWSTEVTLPIVNAEGVNRMTLNAVSENRTIASGGNTYVGIVNAAADGGADSDVTSPEIRLWLDSPDMADGAIVGAAPKLYVEISDSGSGVSLNGSSIGMMPRVAYDGVSLPTATALIHADGEGVARGTYQFENLADGTHTVTVSARDVAGNSATATINFTVVNADSSASLEVSAPLVRDDVTFTLTHSLPGNVATVRLVIRDMEGGTVLSREISGDTYTWDFVGSDGFAVPDGTYRASVIISSSPYYAATPEVEFTVCKRAPGSR